MSCDAIDAAPCQFLCSGGEYSMDSIYPFTHPMWISLFKTIYLHWNMHNALAQHSFFNIRIYEYGYRKLTVTTPPNPLHWLVFFSFCASFSLSGCVFVCACAFSTCNFLLETLMPNEQNICKEFGVQFSLGRMSQAHWLVVHARFTRFRSLKLSHLVSLSIFRNVIYL